jgi:3-hydroxy-3-methylglutaryl CoA synthase/uncharacterized OB-fold protein
MKGSARGIIAYGSYLPFWFVRREAMTGFFGERPERGRRAIASYDEDTTTMGVEAARSIGVPLDDVEQLLFATSFPAYTDKTNATAIHAALRLPRSARATDVTGSVRGGIAALSIAASGSGLAVLADMRFGVPGSADELQGGDGAAAFLFGSGEDVIAELAAQTSITAEFLERWRLPGEIGSRVWEERFGGELYQVLMQEAGAKVLRQAGTEQIDYVVVTTPQRRLAKSLASILPGKPDAPDFQDEIGYLGAADPGVLLADVLDRAEPNQTILLVSGSDGADALVFRTTPQIVKRRAQRPVRAQLSARREISYAHYLIWRGLLQRESPRRPHPAPPAPPPSARGTDWKFALMAARCNKCGTVNVPPLHVCPKCHARGCMQPHPLSELQATIAGCTLDGLSYSQMPAMMVAVIDFDGGGRLECEVADVDSHALPSGTRVEMTFRKKFTVDGVHNYFWKARPVGEQAYGK